jgi:hypothetical protein
MASPPNGPVVTGTRACADETMAEAMTWSSFVRVARSALVERRIATLPPPRTDQDP